MMTETTLPEYPPSAPDVAYAWIKNYIIGLPRNEDAFLNEVGLAKATDTSRTPVREALMRLESEGLLRRIPRKGVYVPQITDADVKVLLDARALVEQWAAGTAGAAIRREAHELQGLIDQQREHVADVQRFIELDIEFHGRVVKLGGNPLLYDFYRSLHQRQLRIGVRAISHGDDRAGQVLREHQAILDAIAQDTGDVAESIREHLDSTYLAATAD